MTAFTNNKKREIFDLFGGRCAYCGCRLDPKTFEVDHIVPRSSSGKDLHNRFPSCPTCNIAKNIYDVEGFRRFINMQISDTHTGRLLSRYYDLEPKEIEFYFEKCGCTGGI